jgi:hypothetical protein
MNNTIPIIARVSAAASIGDRLDGVVHGPVTKIVEKVSKAIDADLFIVQINSIVEKVSMATSRIAKVAGEFSADEITIGLAITGEGSIGIATVGAEATIEIKFSRAAKILNPLDKGDNT